MKGRFCQRRRKSAVECDAKGEVETEIETSIETSRGEGLRRRAGEGSAALPCRARDTTARARQKGRRPPGPSGTKRARAFGELGKVDEGRGGKARCEVESTRRERRGGGSPIYGWTSKGGGRAANQAKAAGAPCPIKRPLNPAGTTPYSPLLVILLKILIIL